MDSFPYLVARGIYHYVDQHKTSDTAAGYAKELVHIAPMCAVVETRPVIAEPPKV
jgi:hypothetical protein